MLALYQGRKLEMYASRAAPITIRSSVRTVPA
jgi:hypothetical protein